MFAPPYPSDAYLLRTEKRYRWRDTAGRVDLAALSLVAKLLPTAPDLMPAHRERLGRVVDRVQKAAVAYAELAKVGMLDERFGFPIIVEVPDGGMRRGVSETGETWESVFTGASYGFLPDSISRDAEEIDIVAGPETSAPNVFIVGFVKPVPKGMESAGSVLDEYKLFIGFRDYESAQACARANWPPERIGTIQTMPMEVLRGLLGFDLDEGMVQKALAVAMNDGLVVTSPNGVVIGRVQKARSLPTLIEVECRGDAADSLRRLLVGLRYYGAIGASGPVYFESDGLRQLSGWDGDGDSKIGAIRVNGEKVYDMWREPLPSALARPVPDDLMEKYRAGQAEMDSMVADIAQETLTRILTQGLVLKSVAQLRKNMTPVQNSAISTATFAGKALASTAKTVDVDVLDASDDLVAKTVATVKLCAIEKGLDASTPIDRRIVYGVVLEPEPFGGRGDGHDETYGPDVIRRAAYNWLASFANLNDSHGRFLSKQEIVPVESFIAPVEFMYNGTVIPQGAWVVAAKICSDVLWARVLSGDLAAWSIEGYAVRECTTCSARMKAKILASGMKQWLCPNCDRLALLTS